MASKLPNTIGATIDAIAKIVEARAALTAKDKELGEQEQILKNHLGNNFDKAGLDGAKGKIGIAALSKSKVPEVQDWDELYKYIKRKGEWDLLQRRPSLTAFRERWDNGKSVPGVECKEIEVLKVGLIKKPAAKKAAAK